VKVIEEYAFARCRRLRHVTLNDGLGEIHDYAFEECKKLNLINIPSTVRVVHGGAFDDNYMREMNFGTAIETFVEMISIGEWWHDLENHLSDILETYNFLVGCNIISRLQSLNVGLWESEIHEMLRGFPWSEWDPYSRIFTAYLESIDDKLKGFELAIWMQNTEKVLDVSLGKHGLSSVDIITKIFSFFLPSGQHTKRRKLSH
jgi:hypothetical protein